jgi:hypothetical protein
MRYEELFEKMTRGPAFLFLGQDYLRLETGESVAAFAWSGIYTSAIDIIWPQSFQSKWRTLEPIVEERQHPADPRNRSKLHSTFLFGCIDQVEEEKRPPLLYEEWLTRKPVAMSLARRLPGRNQCSRLRFAL